MHTPERPVICQVLHSLNVGGAEVLARDFALRSKDDFTTVFACLDQLGTMAEQLAKEGYCVQLLGRKTGFDYRLPRTLAQFCRLHKVSVIHAHQYAPFFYSALCRGMRRCPPIIFTEHGRSFPDYRRPKRVLANRLLLARRDRIVGVGNHVRKALIENEGFSPERVQVIYNGVNLQAYRANFVDRAQRRRALGLLDTDICVLQVARLNALKDHGTAVRAMARLKTTHPSIRLFLVGDGEEKAALVQMICDHGLQQTVTLLGLRDDVPGLLTAADVALLTSVSEGIPLTLIEAMSAELPCVATNVGGVAEVIVHNQTGLLAPAGDDAQIATYIAALAESRERRTDMGSSGLRRAEQFFDARQMHAAYHGLYAELAITP